MIIFSYIIPNNIFYIVTAYENLCTGYQSHLTNKKKLWSIAVDSL
jgi:hypothetical protein